MSASDRLEAVRAAMAGAARRGGASSPATLIAISKTHPADAILPMIAAGQRDFGENRVQEAAAKWPALRASHPELRLHLVGQLQSNKAADAVALFDVIHSLDRPSLVTALARAQAATARRPALFVQVNLDEGEGRGGCPPAGIAGLIAQARAADLDVRGLMTVAPLGREPAPWFALLAKLADDHGVRELSMGMSGDFETAVSLGATHVRVGSALFGARV